MSFVALFGWSDYTNFFEVGFDCCTLKLKIVEDMFWVVDYRLSEAHWEAFVDSLVSSGVVAYRDGKDRRGEVDEDCSGHKDKDSKSYCHNCFAYC